MTKERKLAIQMWNEIKKLISKNELSDFCSISDFKLKFCKEHNLGWTSNCWFCQYVGCTRCPLLKNPKKYYHNDRKMACVDYWILSNQRLDMKLKYIDDSNFEIKMSLRLKSCDNIIKVLQGKNKR